MPRASLKARTRAWIFAYAICAALVLVVGVRGTMGLLGQPFPGFLVFDNGVIAAFYGVDWTGPTADLPFDGAIVEAIDGARFEGGAATLETVRGQPPGTPFEYRVRGGDGVQRFVVPSMVLSWGDLLETFGAYLFVAAMMLSIGGLALALRPDLTSARALCFAMGSIGALFALAIDQLVTYQLGPLYQLIEALTPASIANLALVFPKERASPAARRVIVAAVGGVLVAAAIAESIAFYDSPHLAFLIDGAPYIAIVVLGVLILVSFGESFLHSRDVQERTRAALVFAGGILGLLTPVSALFAFFVLGVDSPTAFWAPFLVAFALFLLYAIVRHDLLQAERFIRLTVGYVIATSAVLVAYSGALALLSRTVFPGADRSAPSFLLVLAVAVSFEPVRRRVQAGIDRVFYRSHVDVARTLEETSAELALREGEDEIADFLERVLLEALNPDWAQVDLGEDRRAPLGDAALEEQIQFRGEALGRIRCGNKRSGAPFSEAESDLVGGLASQAALAVQHARALAALREAQDMLLRTERLAAVGEFAGSVAHGIRNPLAGIRAAAQVSLQRAGQGPLAESLAGILGEADRLEHRIRSLLDFSRPYVLKRQLTNLADVLNAVERSLSPAASGQGVSVSVHSEEVSALADPAYFEEALLELATNALRAMPEGGSLELRLCREGDDAVLRVADTGGGVPEGIRHRLFDLFFTTRYEGSGVGLPTVKKIVELQGGTIELERSDATGTTFRLLLPSHG